MEKKLFKELFNFDKKSKIKAGDGFKLGEGKYPFYTSSNVLTKSIDEFLFEKESLIFGTGGLASIHYCNEKFAVSTDCFVTQPKNSNQIFPKYVYYYLSGNIHILENGFKGAGLKHISKDYLENIEIPLIDLPIQQKIAAILDKSDELRQYNKQLIEKYDALAQSLFLDMFGNPMKNEKNWEKTIIDKVCSKVTDGEHGTVKRVEEGKLYLMARNIRENYIDLNEVSYIEQADHDKIFKRCNVEKGDILLVCVGATIGRLCITPEMESFSLARSVALLKPNYSFINNLYLYNYLNTDFMQSKIKTSGNSSAQAGLYTGKIKELPILVPPINLQNQFAECVKLIEVQKQKAQEALAKSELLFQGLLQQAFNGEVN